MRVLACGFLVALSLCASIPLCGQEVIQVSAKEIQQHTDHHAFPAYPPIAKAAHVQGTVVFDLRIGTTGKIESMDVVSGPEMLRQAAIDCLKQWTFHPFEKDGVPVAATGQMSMIFALSDYHPGPNDEQIADQYFQLEDQCRKAVSAHTDAPAAAQVCKQAADLASIFGPDVRFIEKRSAYVYAATAYGDAGDFKSALPWAKKAVEIVKLGHDGNSGSHAAYSTKGEVEAYSGDYSNAELDMTEAEGFLRKEIDAAGQPGTEKGSYIINQLVRSLQLHAKVLQAMGRSVEAQKKLDEAAKYQ